MKFVVALVCFLSGLTACSTSQVQTAQTDQALVQAVVDAACMNPALQAALAAAVPAEPLACVAGVAGSAIVTVIMSDPALVAKVEALKMP